MDEHMLTTVDNPYNPSQQFDEWHVWDQSAGYNTLAYLGRMIVTSDQLSEADQAVAYEQAIDAIIKDNHGLYTKVPMGKVEVES